MSKTATKKTEKDVTDVLVFSSSEGPNGVLGFIADEDYFQNQEHLEKTNHCFSLNINMHADMEVLIPRLRMVCNMLETLTPKDWNKDLSNGYGFMDLNDEGKSTYYGPEESE